MEDMLVRLYDLRDDWSFMRKQDELGVVIRKPLGAEKNILVEWVRDHFNAIWASEVDVATSTLRKSCFLAVCRKEIIGFACYDATALGFFGPIGVLADFRGRGTGKALLRASLLDMKLQGYGYAIIGRTDEVAFYRYSVGATLIEGSATSVWKNWVGDNRI